MPKCTIQKHSGVSARPLCQPSPHLHHPERRRDKCKELRQPLHTTADHGEKRISPLNLVQVAQFQVDPLPRVRSTQNKGSNCVTQSKEDCFLLPLAGAAAAPNLCWMQRRYATLAVPAQIKIAQLNSYLSITNYNIHLNFGWLESLKFHRYIP